MHRLEAFSFTDFDNQIATFHLFCAKLDLNMDHHPSPHGSPIPKRKRTTKANEVNCISNLTAFSWKAMQRTANHPYARFESMRTSLLAGAVADLVSR